ncbi:MAG: hypothetical protein ACR2OB_09750, partial [Solirubrobacteraceae bacterium]
LCAAVLGTLAIASGAAAAAAGVNINAVEGQSFTGNVVNGLVCPLSRATISWGDGTTSAGTSDGSSGIQGTHTYAEEGSYSGSVSYTYTLGGVRSCPSGAQTTSFQATVHDALLTWSGRNLTGTAGQSLSGVVAHFSDANPAAGAGDFSAQITWGDGTSSSGSVGASAGGGFDVSGTHTYNAAGSYMVSVAIADAGGSAATTSSTAQIAAAPPPPPPPPHTDLTASFRVIPPSPCPETDTVLDASASTPTTGHGPITYHWTITYHSSGNLVQDPGTVLDRVETSDPQLPYYFAYYAELGAFRGEVTHDPGPRLGPTLYDVYDYRLFRTPVQVLLRVQQDGHGGTITARQVRTITFTNPSVTEQVGYAPAYEWFGPGIDAPDWILNPGQRHGCPSLTDRAFFGSKSVPGSVAVAKLAHGAVFLNRGSLIKIQAGCKNPVKNCLASLDLLSGAPKLSRARRHRSLPASLGRKTFVVPAGRTIAVSVRLNARGRALARAHQLRRVTLLLGSVGALGQIVPTIRTVRLRTGH